MMHRLGEIGVVLLLALPFLETHSTDDPDALRNSFFMLLVSLLVLRVLVSAARRKEWTVREDPTRLALLLFLGIHLLALIPAGNRWESIGPLTRMFGGVLVYAFLVSGYVTRPFLLRIGLPILTLSAAGMAALALARIGPGFAGNIELFSAMMLPLAASMTFIPSHGNSRLAGAVSSIPLLLHVIYADSRASWIGAIAGLLALGIVWLIARGSAGAFPHRWAWGIAGGMLMAAVGLAFLLRGPMVADRLKSISDESQPLRQLRMETWNSAIRMGLGSPVFGTGPGNFAPAFPPYRSEREILLSLNWGMEDGWRPVETARNTYLQIFCETGILGLLAFLLVLYVSFRRWVYFIRSAPDREHYVVLSGLFSALMAFLACGLFTSLLSVTAGVLYLVLLLGLIEHIGNQKARYRKSSATEGFFGFGISCMLVTLALAFIMTRSFLAGMERKEGEHRIHQKQHDRAVTSLLRAREWEYSNWRTHYLLAAAQYGQGKIIDAEAHGREAQRLNPNHVPTLAILGSISFQLGAKDRALDIMGRAIRIAPAAAPLHEDLGKMYEAWGMSEEARQAKAKAEELWRRTSR